QCSTHESDSSEPGSFRKKGFESNLLMGKIQRFQCKKCWYTFNANVFHINYYARKPFNYKKLVNAMISASGIRDMARQFRCSPKTIQNRIDRLAQKAICLTAPILGQIDLQEDLAADGLESFILSQFFPTNINILVGQKSQFIYFFNSFYFHRKGRMTEKQKEKAEELYKVAYFEEKAPSKSFKELLDYIAEMMDRSAMEECILDTDENTIYHHQFQKHPGLKGVTHRKTNSKEERNTSNKLFPCNYIDRQIRKDQAEHVRETLQHGRNMNNAMNRFSVYSFWHNFKKPFRINRKKSVYLRHGETAGLDLELVKQIGEQLTDETRILPFSIEGYFTDFQRKLLRRELSNPLNRPAV
nr:hypothetical protein [Spirochaetaceae bacterium]